MSKYLPATLGLATMLIASTCLAQDCVVVATDGLSNALPAKPDADAQRKLEEETVWGRNPFERAAEGEFADVKGVTDENGSYNVSSSVLNREAMSRIMLPELSTLQQTPYGRFISFPAIIPTVTILQLRPADPTRLALDLPSEFFLPVLPPLAFGATSPFTVTPTSIPMQWSGLDAWYSIAIKARPSC